MAGRDDRHLSMRARNATTRLTEYTATRVRYKPVTYERVLTLFVPARVFTGARSRSHVSPLGPARHSPGDSLFRFAKTNSLQFARNLSEYSGEKVPLRVQAPHTPQLAHVAQPEGWRGWDRRDRIPMALSGMLPRESVSCRCHWLPSEAACCRARR